MTWDDELREEIRREFTVGEVFTLDQVYAYTGSFQRLHPRNKHVRDKLRQTLQHLRDGGVVEFLDYDGRYRRLH